SHKNPNQEQNLNSIQTLLSNLKSETLKKLAIPDIDGMTFIDVNDLIRCQSDRSYTSFYLSDGKKIISAKNLREYEVLLTEYKFFRIHHSHLINLKHIKKYMKGEGGYVIMSDDSKVEVSKRRKKEFMDILRGL
ncbi:LytTR family transcriptional regulator, partial [Bacteroidales bacterium AH-315-N07]|nr:LytTR family transcriptional regulator [Bacteroidales bacterium AH-315-N07]